jgi:hypothetical protein
MNRLAMALILAITGPFLGKSALAAPSLWQAAWGHPATVHNETPPALSADQSRRIPPVYAALPPYRDVTVRQLVRLSADARAIRLRFSNELGKSALVLGAVHVGLADEEGRILSGTDHLVTFNGKAGAILPPGAPLLADPITWALPAFARLAISVHYPEETLPPAHTIFALSAWQAAGDLTAAPALPAPAPARSGIHLSEIDILPARPGATLVTFGDSITEGVASTPGKFRGWPDRLAERLQANAATRGWSIFNAGMGSNRLLHDTPSTNALSRFDRDVLAVPGAKAVMVLLGINDIQYSHRYPAQAVRAPEESPPCSN